LIAISTEGCVDTTELILTVNEVVQLYVPNAFTPNGDGVNDIFSPIGNLDTDEGYSFLIYNRWGELVYLSNQPNENWDGTFKGMPIREGIYVWKLNFMDTKAVKHEKMGHVFLCR